MSVKVSELTASTGITSDDLLLTVNDPGGTPQSRKATAQQMLDYVTGSTFNTLTVTSLTSSNVTGSTAKFTTISGTNANISGDLTVAGILTATEYHTTVVSASIIYQSGSTKFGNDSGDTHQFSGSILISGTLNANNTISGTTAQFTTVTASTLSVSGGNLIIYETASIGDYAYILYNGTYDKLVAFPGLYVSGNLTGSGHAKFNEVSGTTAQFTSVTASHTGSGAGLYNLTASGISNFTNDVRAQFTAGTNITIVGGTISSTGGGGGTPGGTNTTIQFNSGSSFSGSTRLSWDYVVNTLFVSGSTNISGTLTATAKSFDIVHPTVSGMRLRYGSLEGPENGVYVRGIATNNIIELPEHWTGLVHEDSITVNLTPLGSSQDIWVDKIENNKVHIGGNLVKSYFSIFAERKDIDKLVVEY